MSWRNEDDAVAAHFSGLLARHGAKPQALDWSGAESQHVRFAALAQVGELEGSSLLDVGCGLGDLLGWLDKQGLTVDYLGLDLTPGLVDEARRRHPGADIRKGGLLGSDFLDAHGFDYVVASGVFYLQQSDPYGFMQAMLERMFGLCRRAVAFNSLSAWSDAGDDGEFRADPGRVLGLCRNLTRRVVLRHDYHPGDFTVYLYREPRP